MFCASYLRRFRYAFIRQRRTQRRGRPLWLESLEDRSVPSIIFNNASTATTSDGGGPVIDHVHLELIFWGSGWDTEQGPTLRAQTEAAADSITGGPYLTYLSQYRASIGSGSRVGSVTIDSTSPASVFRSQDVVNMLLTNLANQTLPDPASDPALLYFVIPQPGSNSNFGGYHSYTAFNGVNAHYGWCINRSGLDGITYYFSHEMGEAVSDPEGTAIQFNPRSNSSWNEIWDGTEAQSYSYRLNGYLVQSWFSQVDHAFVVPTGHAQNFYVSNKSTRVLTVNGDQLADANDTITIDQENGGYKVTLNGEVAQFDTRDFFTGVTAVSSIVVNTGSGDDTVNIEGTVFGRPATVNLGDGTDSVNVSPLAQNLGNLADTVTVNGGSGSDTLNLFDQGINDDLNYTVTSSTVARPGMALVTYLNVANVALNTSNGTDNVTVQSTPAGTALAINGGSGINTVVGSAVDNTWNITGNNAGTLSSASIVGAVTFTSVQNLSGDVGNDTFVFSDGAGISGNLEGGSGGGSLDYSAYSSSVIVDLQTATATGVGGTIANIQNVTGGNSAGGSGGSAGVYNILVGHGGNTLTGGNGRRNLLIAGSSASTLVGGDDDDILIGGTTAYDVDVVSLMAVMDYWSGTSDDYATRVGNLLAGKGMPPLDPTTATSNGGGNTLTGGLGLNLYYGNDTDNTDFDPNSGAMFVPV